MRLVPTLNIFTIVASLSPVFSPFTVFQFNAKFQHTFTYVKCQTKMTLIKKAEYWKYENKEHV